MTYRRDTQRDDESVPLPIETVYNSDVDALRDDKKRIQSIDRIHYSYFGSLPSNFIKHNGRPNRIYFNYPPDWKTSNVGEKIIGIRKMMIRHRDCYIAFTLYIRKYEPFKLQLQLGGCSDDEIIQERINRYYETNFARLDEDDFHYEGYERDLVEYIRVFAIPITVHITSNDTWDDIKERIMNIIRQHDLYHYLYNQLIEKFTLPETLVPKLQRLEQIKDNYKAMLAESDNLIGESIRFWLEPDKDINLTKDVENDFTCIRFVQPNQTYRHALSRFETDFLITRYTNNEIPYYNIYKVFNGILTGKRKEVPSGIVNNPDFHFDPFTSLFFNITRVKPVKGIVYGDGLNPMNYISRFHKRLTFKNVMIGDCQVAASFATQSNHNLIGRTNETFTPIKYYKVNDEDDHFWIEFYDRDRVDAPLTFNDHYIFTMDVVLLQNRKLLYT